MINALKAGKSLKNPVFWKKIQVLAAGLIPLIAFVFPDLDKNLAGVIDGAIVAVISYLTYATTNKMGI